MEGNNSNDSVNLAVNLGGTDTRPQTAAWTPSIIELSDAINLFEEDLHRPEAGMLKAFNFLLGKRAAVPVN